MISLKQTAVHDLEEIAMRGKDGTKRSRTDRPLPPHARAGWIALYLDVVPVPTRSTVHRCSWVNRLRLGVVRGLQHTGSGRNQTLNWCCISDSTLRFSARSLSGATVVESAA